MMEDIVVAEVQGECKKRVFTRAVLERLPDWFGNQQAIGEYADQVKDFPYWAAVDQNGRCLGFISAKVHYEHTGEIFVCGVLPEFQHKGVGKLLYDAAENYWMECDCKYAIVKTLSDKVDFEPYELTRKFYRSLGFQPLVSLTEMWDEENPCLIMFKLLT